MSNCKLCLADCAFKGKDMKKGNCKGYISMSNADRIRAMSDEELAEFLAEEQYRIADIVFQQCGFGLEKQVIYARRLDWLQQPAEEDT